MSFSYRQLLYLYLKYTEDSPEEMLTFVQIIGNLTIGLKFLPFLALIEYYLEDIFKIKKLVMCHVSTSIQPQLVESSSLHLTGLPTLN